MKGRLRKAREHFDKQHKKAQEESKDAQKKLEKAVATRKSAEGVTTALGMVTSGIVTAGTLGVVSPEAAVIQGVFNYVSSFLSRINLEGGAVLNEMEQRRMREDTAKEEKMSQVALNCVVHYIRQYQRLR